MSEIEALVNKFGVKEILFKDSDFVINRKNVEVLCSLLIERDLDLIWSCNARVDMVDARLLSLMRQAGCKMITYGVESGNEEILLNLKKGFNKNQIREAILATKNAGIRCTANIIFGGPGETRSTVAETLDFIKSLNPDFVNFANLTAFPGSALYDLAKDNDWFVDGLPDSFGCEELRLNATAMTNHELSEVLRRSTREFYFRPSYILKRLRHLSVAEIKISLKGLLAIMRN